MKTVGFTLVAILMFGAVSAAVPSNYDCSKPEIVNEEHVHLCCKHPDGHNDVTEQCAKKHGVILPSKSEESVVDLTVETVVAQTCFGQCVFGAWGIMQGDKLNMTAVKAHYEMNYPDDPEYVKEMTYAFDHCHSNSEKNLANFLSNPFIASKSANYCDPMASVVLSCTIKEFFHNCPTTRWAHNDECETARAFSLKCKDQLTIM